MAINLTAALTRGMSNQELTRTSLFCKFGKLSCNFANKEWLMNESILLINYNLQVEIANASHLLLNPFYLNFHK